MSANDDSSIADWLPDQVWNELTANHRSGLVDVRTKPEWLYVGVPDLSEIDRAQVFVEWRHFPEMRTNSSFVDEVASELEPNWPDTLFFICRSGVRSREAAKVFSDAVAKQGRPVRCINFVEGFEGDLDEDRRRGRLNGWKVMGLPWRQS